MDMWEIHGNSWKIMPNFGFFPLWNSKVNFQIPEKLYYVVVANIFHFHPYLGRWCNLTNSFWMGWNHRGVEGLPHHRVGVASQLLLGRGEMHPGVCRYLVKIQLPSFFCCFSVGHEDLIKTLSFMVRSLKGWWVCRIRKPSVRAASNAK